MKKVSILSIVLILVLTFGCEKEDFDSESAITGKFIFEEGAFSCNDGLSEFDARFSFCAEDEYYGNHEWIVFMKKSGVPYKLRKTTDTLHVELIFKETEQVTNNLNICIPVEIEDYRIL